MLKHDTDQFFYQHRAIEFNPDLI